MDLPDLTGEHRQRIACIGESYRRLTGTPLVEPALDPIAALWFAPIAIVAHGLEPDPVFFFGNETALTLFELDFAAFTKLPSRFSAEPLERDARLRLLERVSRHGIIADYEGIRISSTGRRFRISNASVWNLSDESGTPLGQAAAFAQWEPIPS
jgi:hypothetical protein